VPVVGASVTAAVVAVAGAAVVAVGGGAVVAVGRAVVGVGLAPPQAARPTALSATRAAEAANFFIPCI
jgi:hypothetical protein